MGSTTNNYSLESHVIRVCLLLQLNMVCDGAVLKANGQMMFFGGLLTGSLLTGMISDR